MRVTLFFAVCVGAYRGPAHEGWYNPFPGAAKQAAALKVQHKKFAEEHGNLHSLASNVHEVAHDRKVAAKHVKPVHHHKEVPKTVHYENPKEQTNYYPKAKVVKHKKNDAVKPHQEMKAVTDEHHEAPKVEAKVAHVEQKVEHQEPAKVVHEEKKAEHEEPAKVEHIEGKIMKVGQKHGANHVTTKANTKIAHSDHKVQPHSHLHKKMTKEEEKEVHHLRHRHPKHVESNKH